MWSERASSGKCPISWPSRAPVAKGGAREGALSGLLSPCLCVHPEGRTRAQKAAGIPSEGGLNLLGMRTQRQPGLDQTSSGVPTHSPVRFNSKSHCLRFFPRLRGAVELFFVTFYTSNMHTRCCCTCRRRRRSKHLPEVTRLSVLVEAVHVFL